jgi:hypothetical protein
MVGYTRQMNCIESPCIFQTSAKSFVRISTASERPAVGVMYSSICCSSDCSFVWHDARRIMVIDSANTFMSAPELVVARIRDSSNPDSSLIANFAGEREDSNPKVLIRVFPKIC